MEVGHVLYASDMEFPVSQDSRAAADSTKISKTREKRLMELLHDVRMNARVYRVYIASVR